MSDTEKDLTDVPVPDLLDQSGRLRRLGVAAALATLVAVVAALVCYELARADIEGTATYGMASRGGAMRFVGYMTGASWIVTFIVTHWFLSRRAKRKDSFVAQARVRR